MDADRRALLMAVEAHPKDVVTRLIYADWLDEHSELPAATATAELIRLGCSHNPKKKAPPEYFAWIEQNWQRLVPSVMAHNVCITEACERWPEPPPGGIQVERTGQIIKTFISLRPSGKTRGTYYSCRAIISFRLGMMNNVMMYSEFGKEIIREALCIDQPQLWVWENDRP